MIIWFLLSFILEFETLYIGFVLESDHTGFT